MTIQTGITLTVYADPEYYYEVNAFDEYTVTYIEEGREMTTQITFGSASEMEAVALAMLRALDLAKKA